MSNSYDVVVAGAGIAGLAAALTATRLGRKTLVLAGDVLGGNLLSIERAGVPARACPWASLASEQLSTRVEASHSGVRRLAYSISAFNFVG